MNTLYDFVTHVKGVEYIIGLLSIAGFILFIEALKPAPFKTLKSAGKEDYEHIRKTGAGSLLRTMGKVAAAPFIGLAYVAALPFAFAFALAFAVISKVMAAIGVDATFGWRPLEAYLTGGKGKKSEPEKKEEVKK